MRESHFQNQALGILRSTLPSIHVEGRSAYKQRQIDVVGDPSGCPRVPWMQPHPRLCAKPRSDPVHDAVGMSMPTTGCALNGATGAVLILASDVLAFFRWNDLHTGEPVDSHA